MHAQETEVGMRSGHCDQRTRNRIIDRCLAAGQVMRLLVQLPGKRTKHKGFNVEVLTRIGTPLDFTFLNEVPSTSSSALHQRRNATRACKNPLQVRAGLPKVHVLSAFVQLKPAWHDISCHRQAQGIPSIPAIASNLVSTCTCQYKSSWH